MDTLKTGDFDMIGRWHLSQWHLWRSAGQYVPGALHGTSGWAERAGDRRARVLGRLAPVGGAAG
jgi:hypothetical protein